MLGAVCQGAIATGIGAFIDKHGVFGASHLRAHAIVICVGLLVPCSFVHAKHAEEGISRPGNKCMQTGRLSCLEPVLVEV